MKSFFSVRRNFQWRLVLAACSLSIIPILIIGLASYTIAINSLEQEVGRAKKETIKQVQQRIDDKLVSLNKNILQHLFNTSLDEFLNLDTPHMNYTLFQEMFSILNSLEVLVDNVDAAQLYMPNQQRLLSADQGLLTVDKIEPELLKRLEENNPPYFWFENTPEPGSPITRGSAQNITYVREVPIKGETPLGYIIVKLNDRAFFQVYSEMDSEHNSELLILTPTGNIFSDWNKSLLQDDLSSYGFLKDIRESGLKENGYTKKIDGENMLITYWESPYNNWKYVSVVPVKELTPMFERIKILTLLLCLTLIAGCLIAALMLSKHFYQLINNILDLIRGKPIRLPQTNGKEDEFGFIKHYMETLHTLNDSLKDEVDESKPALAASFIQQVLTEPIREAELREKFAYYDLPNQSPFYTVMCMELDIGRGLSERDVNLFLYAVKNIAEEVLGTVVKGAVVKMRADQIVLLVNHRDGETPASRKAEAFRLAEEICFIVKDLLKINATVGVGRCYEGHSEIRRSFKEATDALQYRLIVGSGKVIYVGQVEPETERPPFVYPSDAEQQIMLHVKMGNDQQVMEWLDKFGLILKQTEGISSEHVRMAFMQLVSRALRELYELDPDGGPVLFSYNLYEKVNQMTTMSEMIDWLKEEVFPGISGHMKLRRNDNNHKTIETVLRYIEECYSEDLSQPMMAELAGMPPSHFSQIFKDEVGLTFSDYLIAHRMKKAKDLLLETDMKIAEIAERLRYNNSQNFIRVFKRINGVTPGEFRASNRALDSTDKASEE